MVDRIEYNENPKLSRDFPNGIRVDAGFYDVEDDQLMSSARQSRKTNRLILLTSAIVFLGTVAGIYEVDKTHEEKYRIKGITSGISEFFEKF